MESDGRKEWKEWVEGFDETGKPLERITKSEQLQEQQRRMKKEEVELNKELQKEQFEMLEVQNRLKECNDEYSQERQRLDELRAQQRVTLDTDQKFRILSVTKETIDRFLRKRPKVDDEQMMVDVHFLTGTETTGFNLHINGEGAGSRDAKFLIQLNEKVESLGKQAAKYWGLDPEKVFFLDGDGRIVLDHMPLVDIVLPPVPPTNPHFRSSQSSSSSALVPEEGAAERERDLYMVKGRNYSLTLVRASTVLSTEDLNRPKGEKWEDFTFNERQLEKELETARKKRGGEDGEAAKINMDVIPSLNDLMQQGQEKKRRKRADTRCRLLEFSFFVVCQVLFLIALVPMEGPSLLLASERLERLFANFTSADNSSSFPRSASFHDIHSEQQYWQWLTGPLQRVLLDEGQVERELHIRILKTLTTRFDAEEVATPITNYQFCSNTSAAVNVTETVTATSSTSSTVTQTVTTMTSSTSSSLTSTSSSLTSTTSTSTVSATSTSTSTDTANSTTVSATSTVTYTTATYTTSSTGTTVPVPRPASIPGGDISCIPEQFRFCSNVRAMHILGKGVELGHEVPNCVPRYDIDVAAAYFHSLTHPQVFSYAHGKISTYFSGYRSFLEVSNGTEAFMQSLESFTLSSGGFFQGAAQQVTTVVYGATTNTIFIYHFLVENRLSGGLVTSVHKDIFPLHLEAVESHVYLLLACAASVILLLTEIRRILHCPRACTFEEERSKCSIWSLLFLLLPALILSVSCLMLVQDTFTGNLLEAGRQTDNDLYDYLWLRIKLDRSRTTIVVITLFLFNALMLKYLLLHFPQLLSATQIVKKLAAPLFTVLSLVCVTAFSFGVFLFTVFGSAFSSFEGVATTWLNVVLWAMGYIKNWQEYYRFQPATWTFSIFVALCLIQLTLNFLPAVIMLSHKKEADLVENYSYHTYWASERSKNSGRKSFNPALVGWDFTNPSDPREVFH